MKIALVVGTRPNFMKAAPLIGEIKKRKMELVLIHTGQHYDKQMSDLFFKELKIPMPDMNLGIGSGTLLEQAGNLIIKLEEAFKKEKPDIVLVVGDVTSTFSAAYASKQLKIPLGHIEAGLRSFDYDMPEEINRVLTDRISDYLFTTEESANTNLKNEGVDPSNIFFVGNVMIDTLLSHKKSAERSSILKSLKLKKKEYCVATFHRPSNVDSKKELSSLLGILEELQKTTKIVLPIHPRTKKNLASFGLDSKVKNMKNLLITEPLGYLDFLCLMANSSLVISDSGGIQEETTVLGIPCITYRNNTERPITLTSGTNLLVSTDPKRVIQMAKDALVGKITPKGKIPPLWDGSAASRIVDILQKEIKR